MSKFLSSMPVPEDWAIKKLKDLCLKKDGMISGPFGSSVKKEIYTLRGYKIYGQEQVIRNDPYYGEYYIGEKDYQRLRKYSVKPKDVLISLVGTYGKTLVLPDDSKSGIINPRLIRIRINQELLKPIYLSYFLQSNTSKRYFERLSHGLTVLILNLRILKDTPIFLPPLKEQQKIISILSNIDDLIIYTKNLISKLQYLKKGLMQHFFSEGIRHTEFKETKLGNIPKEWEIKKLEDIMILEYGKGLPERRRLNGSVPVVGSNGIIGYHNEHLVNGPGIVVGRKGSMGKVNWINENFWPIDTTYFIKITDNVITKKWLYYALTNLNFEKLSLGDVIPGLNREYAYSRKILIPKLFEQAQVVKILENIDLKTKNEKLFKKNLKAIKIGLMQDLLTGKKRIKIN